MPFYRAVLPLSRKTLVFVAGIIRRHRASIGSVWRKLNPGQQALLVLAYLRKGETFADLAAGFGVGVATAWRYVNETVELLAARSPKLRTAVRDAKKGGYAYVVLDGTLIPVDRLAADRPFYSGKHKKHGMNLQVIASPDGDILWVSAGRCPGSVHDTKAQWIWGVLKNWRAGLVTLADKGYQGSTWAKSVQGPEQALVPERSQPSPRETPHPGERANAQLKYGRSSPNSAAAPGAQAHSPKPSTYSSYARHNQVETAHCLCVDWRPARAVAAGHVVELTFYWLVCTSVLAADMGEGVAGIGWQWVLSGEGGGAARIWRVR